MDLKNIDYLKTELLEHGTYNDNTMIANDSFCFEDTTWRGTMTSTSFKGFLNDLVKFKKLGCIKLLGQTYYYNLDVWTKDSLTDKLLKGLGVI